MSDMHDLKLKYSTLFDKFPEAQAASFIILKQQLTKIKSTHSSQRCQIYANVITSLQFFFFFMQYPGFEP